MGRKAIHFAPIRFSAVQGNYIRTKKKPILLVIGGNQAIMRGQKSFFGSTNGVVLCDGNQPEAKPSEFFVAVFAIEFPRNADPVISRLDLGASRGGEFPIQYFHGELDDVPTPMGSRRIRSHQ